MFPSLCDAYLVEFPMDLMRAEAFSSKKNFFSSTRTRVATNELLVRVIQEMTSSITCLTNTVDSSSSLVELAVDVDIVATISSAGVGINYCG